MEVLGGLASPCPSQSRDDVLAGDSPFTASFGVAVYPEDASDAARLVRNSDRALYRAKANGRNRVEMFTLDDATEGESGPETNAATPAAS
jgi:predicted signal transduction protein with EAL and GGDEF domain